MRIPIDDHSAKLINELYERLDKVTAYCLSLEGQIEVLKRKIPHTIRPIYKTFEDASAAVNAEFGNFSFLNDATLK